MLLRSGIVGAILAIRRQGRNERIEALDRGRGGSQRLVRMAEAGPVVDRDEGEAQRSRRDPRIEQLANTRDVAGRLGHLGPVHPQVGAMQPGADEWLTGGGLALGDLVLVMRKDEVHAAGMDVERRAEVGHAHRRALDVPARAPGTDLRRPRRFARFGPLPQREVSNVVLAVLVRFDAFPHPEAFRVEPGEATVCRPRGDPEEDRTILRPVGMAAFEERRDEVGHLLDVLGRPRQDVGHGHAQGHGIGQEAFEVSVGQGADRFAGGCRSTNDLVVDIGDVEDPGDIDSAPSKVPNQEVREQERAEIADVDRGVDGRPARVDPDMAFAQRDQRPGQAAERVVQLDGHGAPSRVAIASALTDRPAPSGPSRLPLDALTLTAERSSPIRSAMASRIASRWLESRGRAATIVRSTELGRQPRARTSAITSRSRALPAIPAEVVASAGKRRPRSPRPAAPNRASAIAWRATSPSECPCNLGAAASSTPPRTSGMAGPKGWLSWPIPVRAARAPASTAATRRRSPGKVTFMLPGSPGTRRTGTPQASRRAASSVQVSVVLAGNRP